MLNEGQLRPYQKEFIDAAMDEIDKAIAGEKGRGGIIDAATGLGKSVILAAIAIAAEDRGCTVMHLVHNLKLITQNYEQFLKWADVGAKSRSALIRGKARKQAGINHFFANPLSIYNTMGKDNTGRLSLLRRDMVYQSVKANKAGTLLVLLDEAHYASDEGSAVENFIRECRKQDFNLCIIGLSATPYARTEFTGIQKQVLRKYMQTNAMYRHIAGPGCLFPRVIGKPMTIARGIEDGWLCPLDVRPVPLVSRVLTSSENATDGEIAAQDTEALKADHNKGVINVIKTLMKITNNLERRCLVYCPTVESAKMLWQAAADQWDASVAEYVSGDDSNGRNREDVYKEFKLGKIRILFNVELLTTGYDDASLDCILIARRIRSAILRTQIYGRGTRISPDTGKTVCEVYEGFAVPEGGTVDAIDGKTGSWLLDSANEAKARELLSARHACVCGIRHSLSEDGEDCSCGRPIRFRRVNDYAPYWVDIGLQHNNQEDLKEIRNFRLNYMRTGELGTPPVTKGCQAYADRIIVGINQSRYGDPFFIENTGGHGTWNVPVYTCPICGEEHYAWESKCPRQDMAVFPQDYVAEEFSRFDEFGIYHGDTESVRIEGLEFYKVNRENIRAQAVPRSLSLETTIFEVKVTANIGGNIVKNGFLFPRDLKKNKIKPNQVDPWEFMFRHGFAKRNSPTGEWATWRPAMDLANRVAASFNKMVSMTDNILFANGNYAGRRCVYILMERQ